MTSKELAEEAFGRLTDEERAFFDKTNENPEASFTEPPPFENLSPAVKSNYLEIAEKGGDASRFGQIVQDILKEQKRDGVPASNKTGETTETDVAAVEDKQAGENLDDTIEELMRHKREELADKAEALGIAVPDNATKQQISDLILEAQAALK